MHAISDKWPILICETWLDIMLFVLPFQRKQKEVQKENEFYFQLLQQALPADQIQNMDKGEFLDGNMNWKNLETLSISYYALLFILVSVQVI